jgi:hypothetical protein
MQFGPILQACVEQWLGDSINPTPSQCNLNRLPDDTNNIQIATANRLAITVPSLLATDLNQIHARAPNAKIVLMGYPLLFESGADCVYINNVNTTWLNSVSSGISQDLADAAAGAVSRGIAVKYEDPEPFFAGHNLCSAAPAENGLLLVQSPGDKSTFTFPVPGPNFNVFISQQSDHPNITGTTDYALALQNALSGFYP